MPKAVATTAQVTLTLRSRNGKTGPIPVSTTSAETCPPECPLQGEGCYADAGPLALHWRAVTERKRGVDWSTFTRQVAALPPGTLWRHNQAGDLPGAGSIIDDGDFRGLVDANEGRDGFTFSHKPVLGQSRIARHNRDLIAHANANGFTVNLSGNNLAHADELADLGIAPVTVILDAPEGVRHSLTTPAGRKVESCPATYLNTTCADCRLCAKPQRKVIVGFPLHGARVKAASHAIRKAETTDNKNVRITHKSAKNAFSS